MCYDWYMAFVLESLAIFVFGMLIVHYCSLYKSEKRDRDHYKDLFLTYRDEINPKNENTIKTLNEVIELQKKAYTNISKNSISIYN